MLEYEITYKQQQQNTRWPLLPLQTGLVRHWYELAAVIAFLLSNQHSKDDGYDQSQQLKKQRSYWSRKE